MMRAAILIALLATAGFADCTLSAALDDLRPGAQWVLRGNTYSGIQWLDQTQVKPTAIEVAADINNCIDQQTQRLKLLIAARYTLKLSTATVNDKMQALIQLLNYDR